MKLNIVACFFALISAVRSAQVIVTVTEWHMATVTAQYGGYAPTITSAVAAEMTEVAVDSGVTGISAQGTGHDMEEMFDSLDVADNLDGPYYEEMPLDDHDDDNGGSSSLLRVAAMSATGTATTNSAFNVRFPSLAMISTSIGALLLTLILA